MRLIPFFFLVTAGFAEEPHRSPSDLGLSPDGRHAVVVNSTSNTVSLVDLAAQEVASEIPVGLRPGSVAISGDGLTAVVTNWLSDSITVLKITPPKLKADATFFVGDEPRGIAFAGDGNRVFVALSGEDAVIDVDLETQKEIGRVKVGREPWHLAFTPGCGRLAVGNTLSRSVTILDASPLRVSHTVKLRGRNLRHVAVSPDGEWAYLPFIAERGRSTTEKHIDFGWVIGNRVSRVPLEKSGPREAIAMDTRGKAVGDLEGIAVSPDGKCIAVTAGGTHELILMRTPLPFVAYGGPDDHIDPGLLADKSRFRRVPLGGRPLGVVFSPDGKSVVVANYLSNALQVVDFEAATLTATIPLGGPDETSPARHGAEIFYDAKYSFNQWYSCHSCHTDGHTNGGLFDTLGDDRYEALKKVPSLRGVTGTAPWTWHGSQEDLRASVIKSFDTTMRGPEPGKTEVDAMMAYLETLDFVPPGSFSTKAVERGEKIFQSRRCHECHPPPRLHEREGL